MEEMGFNVHRNCPLAWKTNAVSWKTVRGDRSSNAETSFAEFRPCFRQGQVYCISLRGRKTLLRFWATVCETVRHVLSDRCLSVLSVTLVYCGQTVGWIKMKLATQVCLGPRQIVLDGTQLPLPQSGRGSPIFSPYIMAKWLDGLRCHLVAYVGRPRPRQLCVRWGPSSSLPKRGQSPPHNFRPISIVVERLDGSKCHLVRR